VQISRLNFNFKAKKWNLPNKAESILTGFRPNVARTKRTKRENLEIWTRILHLDLKFGQDLGQIFLNMSKTLGQFVKGQF